MRVDMESMRPNRRALPRSRVVGLGVAYWAIVFTLAFATGVLRTFVLVPHIGVLPSLLIELPIILAAGWLAATRLLRRDDPTPADRAAIGALAFVLTMASEVVLASATGVPFVTWLASIFQMPGLLGLAGQLAFGAVPMLAGRDATRR